MKPDGMNKTCPRRKIVSATFKYDITVEVWILRLECGHIQERRYLSRSWKHPKTTQCGQCWRES